MADESDIAQILKLKHRQNILNIDFKIYVTVREMRAFAEASVCRGKHFVSLRGLRGRIFFHAQPACQPPCATRKMANVATYSWKFCLTCRTCENRCHVR